LVGEQSQGWEFLANKASWGSLTPEKSVRKGGRGMGKWKLFFGWECPKLIIDRRSTERLSPKHSAI